jgi:S1-C subfamily serine protease
MGRRMVLEVGVALLVGALLGTGMHLWLAPTGASATADVAVAGISVERPGGAGDEAAEAATEAVVRVDAAGCGGRRQGSATLLRDVAGREVLLTNAHVVRGASSVRVQLPGGERVEVAVLGGLVGKDAVLLDPVPLRRSGLAPAGQGGEVGRGDLVVVAGHPGGGFRVDVAAVVDRQRRVGYGSSSEVVLVGSLAEGGHSGGAVLDRAGRVVGLVAARDPGTGHVVAYQIDELLSAGEGPRPGC